MGTVVYFNVLGRKIQMNERIGMVCQKVPEWKRQEKCLDNTWVMYREGDVGKVAS